MKKALIVGVDYYQHGSPLHGCVTDAHSVNAVLDRHSDGTKNFGIQLLTATGANDAISRTTLKEQIEKLFADNNEIALFYFSGHGHLEVTGGYLITSEAKTGDDGLSLNDLLIYANRSKATNKVIILDTCHSGIAGNPPSSPLKTEISEGVTILTASTKDQYAVATKQGSVFTRLLVDAMSGAAGNLVGDVTPGSVYAHIDQSLGEWEQRPVFKTNIKNFVSLRKVQPPIPLADLKQLIEFFPTAGHEYSLDPTYEPESKGRDPGMPAPIKENTRKFATLQKYNRVNLLVPVDAPHMWHAAMGSKTCKLTVLGEHYRSLVERGQI